jgi:hypothetical protein
MIEFPHFKVLTFDCYGTLIDWDSAISKLVQPWLGEVNSEVPPDLVVSAFALMQAKHQQTRLTLLYPEVLRRSWRDIEDQFGWDENSNRADEFAVRAALASIRGHCRKSAILEPAFRACDPFERRQCFSRWHAQNAGSAVAVHGNGGGCSFLQAGAASLRCSRPRSCAARDEQGSPKVSTTIYFPGTGSV